MVTDANERDRAFAECGIPGLDQIKVALEAEFGRFGIFDGGKAVKDAKLLDKMQLEKEPGFIFRDLIVDGVIWRQRLEGIAMKGNARLELTRVLEAAKSLIEALRGLHFNAISALGGGDIDMDGTNSIAEHWTVILSELIDLSKEALEIADTARGRPQEKVAQSIAFDLCRYHYYFKGKWPTTSTKSYSFSVFLDNVYRILGINVDAMGQIKVARKRIRHEYPDLK